MRIDLRWRDFDAMGHVSNSVYIELLDESRGRFVDDTIGGHVDYVVARVEVDYLKEVVPPTCFVDVAHEIVSVGDSSLRIRERMDCRGSQVLACEAVIVLWDSHGRRARRLTAKEKCAVKVPS